MPSGFVYWALGLLFLYTVFPLPIPTGLNSD